MAYNNLLNAKNSKQDEFYTQMNDIQEELKNYKEFFKGKTVLCNCDDPYESNFFKYFALNFNYLGLKKLIATCYDGSPIAGEQISLFDNFGEFDRNLPKRIAHKIEINEVFDFNCDGAIDLTDVEYLIKNSKNSLTKLKGNGDFRSEECIELLKEADVVVTNPPFSLFREYVDQLIKYNKKFLIIGNQNAISYKEIFKLIKENKIWLGVSIHSGDREFRIPNNYQVKSKSFRVDGNGNRYIRVVGVRWWTNIDNKDRHAPMTLYKNYSDEKYPKYENYDAINVDTTAEIPCDYFDKIGVPITFLDKNGNPTGKFTINAKGTLYRKHRSDDIKAPAFKDVETGELYQSIYARIIIRRKA